MATALPPSALPAWARPQIAHVCPAPSKVVYVVSNQHGITVTCFNHNETSQRLIDLSPDPKLGSRVLPSSALPEWARPMVKEVCNGLMFGPMIPVFNGTFRVLCRYRDGEVIAVDFDHERAIYETTHPQTPAPVRSAQPCASSGPVNAGSLMTFSSSSIPCTSADPNQQ
jgi:hypothetical protein